MRQCQWQLDLEGDSGKGRSCLSSITHSESSAALRWSFILNVRSLQEESAVKMKLQYRADGWLSPEPVELVASVGINLRETLLQGQSFLDSCSGLKTKLDGVSDMGSPELVVGEVLSHLEWASSQSPEWHTTLLEAQAGVVKRRCSRSRCVVLKEAAWGQSMRKALSDVKATLQLLSQRQPQADLHSDLLPFIDFRRSDSSGSSGILKWLSQQQQGPLLLPVQYGMGDLTLAFKEPVDLTHIMIRMKGQSSTTVELYGEKGRRIGSIESDEFLSGQGYWKNVEHVLRVRIYWTVGGRPVEFESITLDGKRRFNPGKEAPVALDVKISAADLVLSEGLEALNALESGFEFTRVGDVSFLEMSKSLAASVFASQGEEAVAELEGLMSVVEENAPACQTWVAEGLSSLIGARERSARLAYSEEAFTVAMKTGALAIMTVLRWQEERLYKEDVLPPGMVPTASAGIDWPLLTWQRQRALAYDTPIKDGVDRTPDPSVILNDLRPKVSPAEFLVPILLASERGYKDGDTHFPTGESAHFDQHIYALVTIAIPRVFRKRGAATGYVLTGVKYITHSQFLRLLAEAEAERQADAQGDQPGKGSFTMPPTVFVHGYNTSVEKALLQAALFAADVLEFGAIVICRAWPSEGDRSQLTEDGSQTLESGVNLAKLLESMLRNLGEGFVNLFGHSMGVQILGLALSDLVIEAAAEQPWALRCLVICGSITKSGVWSLYNERLSRKLAMKSRRLPRNVRYFSPSDFALYLFDWLTGGKRLDGNYPGRLDVAVEAVDVSDALTLQFQDWASHSYHFWVPAVTADIREVLAGSGAEEQWRRVETIPEEGVIYHLVPEKKSFFHSL